jgi:ABC-type multidrug transport system ATPase subunit
MQFGAKPLFENISVKFGGGNRYGLIGANGCGKSTFMKILGGELEPTSGNVSLDPGVRLGKLRQDQFAYEEVRVLDVVMMGHEEMWKAAAERDAIYANPDATDEDYMKAAELEGKYAEYGGYTAEAKAGELLLGIGIPIEQHNGPMSNVAPGWKLRVLLAQALFSDPDVLLLDDWGLAKPSAEQRRDLLEILEDRHGSRSTIVTSQLPLDQWHANIGDSTLADAIMDRLVHNAYKIKLEGDSLRKQQSNLTTTNEIE